MAKIKIVSKPTTTPIDINVIKQHLRVYHTQDDDYINDLVIAATEYIEELLGRKLITQTWTLYLDGWSSIITLPHPPIASISSITYTDEDNNEYTLSTSDYTTDLIAEPAIISIDNIPNVTLTDYNGIKITYVCGYDTYDDVPMPIRQAIKILAADMYENREDIIVGTMPMMLPLGASHLIANYRMWQ